MGQLSTHVLDTANGCPAEAMRIDLFLAGQHDAIASVVTNADGRCDKALLEGTSFLAGEYQLVFHAGEYFSSKDQNDDQFRFLDRVVIRFGVNNTDENYHVPLLISPFGYSTYRGS